MVGHAASILLPGIGKGIKTALNVVSEAGNAISKVIPAKLGSKLEKGVSTMDKIQNPVSGIGGKILNGIFKRDRVEHHSQTS